MNQIDSGICSLCARPLIDHGTLCPGCEARYCWRCHELLFPADARRCQACGAGWPGPLVQVDRFRGLFTTFWSFPLEAKLMLLGCVVLLIAIMTVFELYIL